MSKNTKFKAQLIIVIQISKTNGVVDHVYLISFTNFHIVGQF